MKATLPKIHRRNLTIDTMRGLAILLVVIYHMAPSSWSMPSYDESGWINPAVFPWHGAGWLLVPPLHFGYVGVHLFFVISGFCIHASCRRGLDLFPGGGPLDGRAVKRYALRRLLRIAPPYWIALLLLGVVAPLIAISLGWVSKIASWWDLGVHALFVHGFSEQSIFSINPAFWSLATEMEFYFVYPLVAWAILRFGLKRVLVGALLLSLAWRAVVLLTWAPTRENFMIYRVWLHGFFVPRWYEWILGCWIAEALGGEGASLSPRPRHAVWGGALIMLAMLCRVHVMLDKLCADVLFSTGLALLLYAMLTAERLRGASSGRHSLLARALAAVGRPSYSIYLLHQPILYIGYLTLMPRLMVAAAVSVLFSLTCERPFEKLSQRIRRREKSFVAASDKAQARG